jgi:hypothetical protein
MSDEKLIAAKTKKLMPVVGVLNRFPRAILEIARVSAWGCAKYKVLDGDLSFLDSPGAATMYSDAEVRHLLAEFLEGPSNSADGNLLHKAQKAWNALADLEVYLLKEDRRRSGKADI